MAKKGSISNFLAPKPEAVPNAKTEKPKARVRRTSYSVPVSYVKALRILAAKLDVDQQDLIAEAIADVLRKHGETVPPK